MARRALFRLDASPTIGVGHGMRCLALADALAERGWSCRFALNPGASTLLRDLAPIAHDLVEGEGLDDPARLGELAAEPCDLLVVDHYGLAAPFEAGCRVWARRVLVVDDLADRRHEADVLVDPTEGRGAEAYKALCLPDAQILVGAGYALLSPRFAEARPAALARREHGGSVGVTLVTLGGAAPADMIARLTRAAREALPAARVDVAAGATTVEGFDDDPQVRVHQGRVDMAALGVEADLALGAAGASSWERCCLGLPAVLVEIADNQRGVAAALAAKGAARSLGPLEALDDAVIVTALRALAGDPERLRAMARAAAAVCDGRGAARVADAVSGL